MSERERAADELYAACEAAEYMRRCQRRYFATRAKDDLELSRAAERRTDALLKAALYKARGELFQEALI